MKRRWFAVAACIGLVACVALAVAQTPGVPGGAPAGQPGAPAAGVSWPAGVASGRAAGPDQQVQELLAKWKATEDKSQRGEIETKLRAAVQDEFRSRLDQHEQEIKALEAQVRQLREQLDRRREKQAEIVDFRVQQLLREAQGLGWATEPVGPRPMGAGWSGLMLGPGHAGPEGVPHRVGVGFGGGIGGIGVGGGIGPARVPPALVPSGEMPAKEAEKPR